MSHSNYTRNIWNIKDENITFEENCLELIKIKGITTKVFHGKLTYTPTFCPNCRCIYEPNPETIIKYGFKKNCKIKVDKACGYRKFNHLKARVMLIKGLLNPIKAN